VRESARPQRRERGSHRAPQEKKKKNNRCGGRGERDTAKLTRSAEIWGGIKKKRGRCEESGPSTTNKQKKKPNCSKERRMGRAQCRGAGPEGDVNAEKDENTGNMVGQMEKSGKKRIAASAVQLKSRGGKEGARQKY